MMRTTIDLPPDLHSLAKQIAHEQKRSMSDVIAQLIRQGLRSAEPELAVGARGLPLIRVGRPITSEDVRSLDDDE